MRNNTTDELLRDSISNLKKFINSENGKIKLTVMILLALATGLAFHYEPTLLSVFLFLKKYLPDSYSQKQIRYAFYGIKKRKLVHIVKNSNRESNIVLTNRGKREIKSFSIDTVNIIKPTKWDNKWRILIFDIPIRFRKGRDGLRWKIKELGFCQLQKSVWVYPYPCEKEISMVTDFFGVRN